MYTATINFSHNFLVYIDLTLLDICRHGQILFYKKLLDFFTKVAVFAYICEHRVVIILVRSLVLSVF